MNQEYRERVKRHLEAGGDPKYVNVKKKAASRHKSEALEKAKGGYDVERGRKMGHDTIKHVVKKEFRGERHKEVNETYNKMK